MKLSEIRVIGHRTAIKVWENWVENWEKWVDYPISDIELSMVLGFIFHGFNAIHTVCIRMQHNYDQTFFYNKISILTKNFDFDKKFRF